MMLLTLILLALAQGQSAPPPLATIVALVGDLPDADHVRVSLKAKGKVGPLAPLASQELLVGGVPVPLQGQPDVAVTPEGFEASFTLELAQIPEALLTLDLRNSPVRFQARSPLGKVVLAAESKLDLADPGVFKIPIERIYQLYAKLVQLSWGPTWSGVDVKALLSFYNPLSFPLTVRKIEYRLGAGETELLLTERPGFRLKPRQFSDVLLEEQIPFSALGAAAQAVLAQEKLTLQAWLTFQTPQGEKLLPLTF
ncbi:MAG: hypothetical protein ACUVRQ_10110 [Thermoanaerobaculaceae bacterium]